MVAARGVTKETILAHLALVGLEGHCDKPVSRLSGGMRRRVAIVRAVLSGAQTLYLDEPFTGLDEETKRRVVDYILTFCDGRTIIAVSHCAADAGLLKAKEIRI